MHFAYDQEHIIHIETQTFLHTGVRAFLHISVRALLYISVRAFYIQARVHINTYKWYVHFYMCKMLCVLYVFGIIYTSYSFIKLYIFITTTASIL